MSTYRLQLTLDGVALSPLTIEGDTTPDLAQAVYRHARGHLGSSTVTIQIAGDGLIGTVLRSGVEVGEFALGLVGDEPTPSGAVEGDGIRWGWSLSDIDRAVRIGITRNIWCRGIDTEERYAAGWHAAVELLYTSDQGPTRHDLIRAAWSTADDLTRRSGEERGIPRQRGDGYTGRTDMPRWHAYWTTTSRPTPSPEEPIVERMALAQIWPRLTPGQQEALHALAAHGTYQSAADALGLTYNTFFRRISTARQRVLALWWEGETPVRGWADRRIRTENGGRQSMSAHVRKRRRAAESAA